MADTISSDLNSPDGPFWHRIQTAPIDCGAAQQWLSADIVGAAGATVLFTGQVRSEQGQVSALSLEHYPGMSEKVLAGLIREVAQRWPLLRALAWHRVGDMGAGDAIVVVGVAAAHRQAAFEACSCLMDRVKTEVPLWKKVSGPDGSDWVDARDADLAAARRWHDSGEADER
ncbi:molybdenum cofactor biosynthesis protein MoaE [Alcanivorax sp. JB21]|uniref:molybdenum cofactor biosynthesis protein MoaE n=1 Tax=Alcanivorax limicola TaxID=2874102 RepID=UPI001CBBC298|nr:molybdenum cofactor biosynthesis protein MoaE [Alcanivorax limicola]MBZ2187814.1 molybdenum cofactor biosynthesis protein MoaE [Alcanivorax limicola]